MRIPRVVDIFNEDEIRCVEIYPLEEWLRGMVDYDVPDETLAALLFNRGIRKLSPASEISARDRELCYADLLMWLSGSSIKTGGEMESDNGWQHQKSSKNVSNRKELERRAMAIYGKYDDPRSKERRRTIIKPIYG